MGFWSLFRTAPLLSRENDDSLNVFYPKHFKVHMIQVVHRHGQRSPIASNIAPFIPSNWPLCHLGKNSFHALLVVQERMTHGANSDTSTPTHPKLEHPLGGTEALQTTIANGFRLFKLKFETLPTHKRPSVAVAPEIDWTAGELTVTNFPASFYVRQSAAQDSGRCYNGQLTDLGRRTLFEFGGRLRALYVDRLGVLPAAFVPERFYLRATEYARAIESLQSLVCGFYPECITQMAVDMPDSGFPHAITIHTRKEADETMYERSDCPFLKAAYKDFFGRFEQEKAKAIESVKERFKMFAADPDRKFSYHRLYDFFTCYTAHGFPIPFGYKTEDVLQLEKLSLMKEYGHYIRSTKAASLAIGRFLEELTERVTKYVNSSTIAERSMLQPMQVFSGHDATVSPLLKIFNLLTENSRWPPFAANIIFELIEDKTLTPKHADVPPHDAMFMRVKYLEKPVVLDVCEGGYHAHDKTLCSLKKWFEITRSLIPHDYESECKVKSSV